MPSEITLFRQSVTIWPRNRVVHVLHEQHGSMLLSPEPCQTVLAEVLAERVTVSRDRILEVGPTDLIDRGYCGACIATLVG
jgi:hypothetical protein